MSAKIAVLVACDVADTEALDKVVEATSRLPEVIGYKLGAEVGATLGLLLAVNVVRQKTSKLIVYDHQKAGNDIPDITARLVRAVARTGVGGMIAFPFAGPASSRAFVETCREVGLQPIIGALMTHDCFLLEEGGYISRQSCLHVLEFGAALGVTDFVLPATRPQEAADVAERIRQLVPEPRFWCPGIGRQGGNARAIADTLGSPIVAIVGSSVYAAADPAAAVRQVVQA